MVERGLEQLPAMMKTFLLSVSSVDYSGKCMNYVWMGHAFPKTEVTVIIDDNLWTVGLVQHLPADVLLGTSTCRFSTDLPGLMDLLQGGRI